MTGVGTGAHQPNGVRPLISTQESSKLEHQTVARFHVAT